MGSGIGVKDFVEIHAHPENQRVAKDFGEGSGSHKLRP